MITPEQRKEFIDIFVKTHLGVGLAFFVVAAVVGATYATGCGNVIVTSSYGDAAEIEAVEDVRTGGLVVEGEAAPAEAAHDDHGDDH